jgi:two-component system sensor histidine kinase/response regulator
MRPEANSGPALRIALLYALFGSAWILGSDWLLGQVVSDPATIVEASAVKGWVFIGVTAALVFLLVRRMTTPVVSAADGDGRLAAARLPRPSLWIAAAAGIVALTAVALHQDGRSHVAREAAQVEAVADMRARQVAAWLQERQTQAGFASSSALWAELYQRWNRQRDNVSAEQLLQRVIEMRKAFGHHSVQVLDEQAEVVLAEDPRPGATPEVLRRAGQRAMASGHIEHTGLYRVQGIEGGPWLDIVAPLQHTGRPARAAVVLRIDAARQLLPLLGGWPAAGGAAVSSLLQHDDQQLSTLGASGQRSLGTPGLLPAQVVRGERAWSRAAEGRDWSDQPVLGAVQAVPGTNWLVMAQVDAATVAAAARQHSLWIIATGGLALLGVAVAAVLARERRALEQARSQQAVQVERLHALALVQAIADGSSDAIFAKDRAGRYLLCNREACRLMGKPLQELLGRDDQEIFSAEDAAGIMANDARVMADNRVGTYEEVIATHVGVATFLATKGPLHDEHGRVAGMFGISRDISDRKRAEAALAEEVQRRRLLFEESLDGIVVFDEHGRVQEVNASFAHMIGHGVDDVIQMNPSAWDLNWPNEQVAAQLREGGRGSVGFETVYRHKDGSHRHVDVRANAVLSAGRRLVFAVCRDITEQRRIGSELDTHRHHLQELVDQRTEELQRLNQALSESERFIHTLADNQPGMLAYWDRDLRCRFANRAYREWVGLSTEQMTGALASSLASRATLAGCEPGPLQAALAGEPQRFQRVPSRQPRQERLPGQHEPRDPHPDERHHRPHPPAARDDPRHRRSERLGKIADAAATCCRSSTTSSTCRRSRPASSSSKHTDFSLATCSARVRDGGRHGARQGPGCSTRCRRRARRAARRPDAPASRRCSTCWATR